MLSEPQQHQKSPYDAFLPGFLIAGFFFAQKFGNMVFPIIDLAVVQNLNILIACEESDRVRSAFAQMGFNAWSCDLLPTRNPDSSKHLQMDVFEAIQLMQWDVLIGFPPCTHLCLTGAHLWRKKRELGIQQEAIQFFVDLYNQPIKHIALENPMGILNQAFRKFDQKIQPYFFGDPEQKATCLWLKNLPKLLHYDKPNLFGFPVTHCERKPRIEFKTKDGRTKKVSNWFYSTYGINPKDRAKIRSTTFQGIADAMAEQWGNYLIDCYKLNLKK